MKIAQNLGIYSILLILVFSFTQCKTQAIEKEVPFTIIEKNYFYWVGGKKGTNGLSIKIVGNFNTTNLNFTTIYFKNREYEVIPQFNTDKFVLKVSYTLLNTKGLLFEKENTNVLSEEDNNIPFELKEGEAVIVYTINGKNYYYKISGVKQLDTVYYP